MRILRKQDQWLIKRWAKARQLEDSMESARQRYAELFTEIHKQVRKTHSALTRMYLHTQPRDIDNWGGQVGFAKAHWPGRYEEWPTGIYIWGISLDELTSDTAPAPTACIWLRLNSERTEEARQAVLRRRLAAKAGHVFKNRRLNWTTEDEDDDNTCLWYPLPEGSEGLLKLLGTDERTFVDCIAKHVNLLAAFVPALDAVLLKRK